jgi:amino acid permease
MSMTGVLLALVPLAVLALTVPEKVTQVATLAWGRALGQWAFFVANLFALCAMMTSYWAVGGSLLTNIVDKFKFKSETDRNTRIFCMVCVVLPPFVLAYSGLVSFVDAIYLAGTFGGVIMSILPVMMINKARVAGDRTPEWQNTWTAHKGIQSLLIILFCGGAVYAILDLVGILPSGW